jgi:hypothetical protein
MNVCLRFFHLIGLAMAAALPLQAASTNNPSLTVELRDGSRVIGKSGDEKLLFRSEILGEIKLPLEEIRVVECQSKTNSVKLTTANGDTLVAAFGNREIHIETSFGNVKISVDSIRRLQVSTESASRRMKMGLVALWSGEGNGTDVIGGNTAVQIGPVIFSNGKQGQAFFLDGNNAYLQIHAGSTLDVGKGDGFTVEGWINPVKTANYVAIIEYERELGTGNGSDVGLQLGIHQASPSWNAFGCLVANIKDVNDGDHIFSSPANLLVPGVWQHVALCYDKVSGTGVIYLNGIPVARSNLGSFTPQTSYANLLVGARTTFGSVENPVSAYSGGLDEIGIYNRALSAAEIQAICTEENNGEPLPPPTPARSGGPFNGPQRSFISE